MTQTMYKGDTAPDIVASIRGETNGSMVAVDLSSAASVKVIAVQMGRLVFSKATAKPSDGIITVTWSAGDTATVGPIDIEFEVTWAPGRVQTFRGSEQILIVPDLG